VVVEVVGVAMLPLLRGVGRVVVVVVLLVMRWRNVGGGDAAHSHCRIQYLGISVHKYDDHLV